MKKELQNARENYTKAELNEEDLLSDPLEQFKTWYKDYEQKAIKDPNAFILATADKTGRVSSRVLLLKGVDQGGFEFYTNYSSAKGQQLADNNQVSMTFYWPEMERQIRVEGAAEKMPASESEEYFLSRPRESQLGAWVSPQSHKIDSRKILEERSQEIAQQYQGKVPKPENWGGYRIYPDRIEFWQGRPSRLHDRFLFEKHGDSWQISRLAP